MQSELKSLSKIFSETIFRIPDYQRGYSWQDKHLKDFWNDIEQLPEDKSHYTGVLTLEPVSKENYQSWEDDLWIIESKRYTPLYVVDGQQRLTTALILLQCILESMSEGELLNFTEKSEIQKKYIHESKGSGILRSYLFGYEKDNPSHEFLKQEIFGEQSEKHSANEETIYTKNLNNAKKYFSEKIEEVTKEKIEAIFTKLTQHLHFNIFYIEKDLDVFVTFETMNNRGKPLSHLELLKNRLIYLSTKFNVDKTESEQLRRSINESWKTIYHYLGKINKNEFTDDTYLKTHFIFHYGPSILESDENISRHIEYIDAYYADYLLDEKFSPKRINPVEERDRLTIEELHEYSKSIKTLVKTYYETAHPELSRTLNTKEKELITKINRIDKYDLFVTCATALTSFKKGPEREKLIKNLERLGFMTTLNGYYFNSIAYIESCIRVLSKKVNVDRLNEFFEQFCNNFSTSSELREKIKNIGKDSSSSYYGWRALRYFMYEYEQELRTLSKTSRELLEWQDIEQHEFYSKDYKSIEHIYPQRPKDKYWLEQFEKYTIKERNRIRNSLGNLLPASQPKNSSLGNKSFLDKKGSEQNQTGYRYGCLSEIQVSMSEDWGAKEILRRGIYLLNFMERRWDLQLGTDKNKCEILGLEFIIEKEKISLEELMKDPPKPPKIPKTR